MRNKQSSEFSNNLITKKVCGGKQPAMISMVVLVVVAIVSLAVASLAVSTGSIFRRQSFYGDAARASFCAESVTNTLVAKTNLGTMFAACEPGQCVILGTDTCGACGESNTMMTCQDSQNNPPLVCNGYIRIGYKLGTSAENLTATADCGKSSYSINWDYAAPAPGGPCAGGGLTAPGVTCGSPASSGLY